MSTGSTQWKTPYITHDGDLIRELRASLIGKDGKVVGLQFEQNNNYFKPEFIEACIQALERKMMLMGALDDSISPLERLAIQLLTDSAGINLDEMAKKRKPPGATPR